MQPPGHVIHDDRLQQLIIQMNALVYEQTHDSLEITSKNHQKIKKLAEKAVQLSGTSKSIIEKLPSLGLSLDEQASFIALAEKLPNQSRKMEAKARKGQIEAIPAMLEQLTQTCGSCHALFGKSHGLLERCRDTHQTC
jgi:cytochrome c556